MRIPTTKIYRAFAELDDFTDEQCERLMRRVKLRIGTNVTWNLSLVVLYIVLLFVVLFVLLAVLAGAEIASAYQMGVDAVSVGVVLGVPAAICLGLRDFVLRKRLVQAIDYAIDRVRCLACRYILIGQVARDEHVVCPECGSRQHLAQLGITEADLIPPEAHAPPV
ncbi:hypothetical protein OT109_10365 [Phycisphaeraceae bacterium D3-23]